MEDMLQLQKRRKAAPATRPMVNSPEDVWGPVPTPSGEEVLAELPCIFAPGHEPEGDLGEKIAVRFWQPRYKKLWQYASAKTGGAVAIRYCEGYDAFALWPAHGELIGLNMGRFPWSVVTVHPFPLVRLILKSPPAEQAKAAPEELHRSLRSLYPNFTEQSKTIQGMTDADRVALIRWLVGRSYDRYS